MLPASHPFEVKVHSIRAGATTPLRHLVAFRDLLVGGVQGHLVWSRVTISSVLEKFYSNSLADLITRKTKVYARGSEERVASGKVSDAAVTSSAHSDAMLLVQQIGGRLTCPHSRGHFRQQRGTKEQIRRVVSLAISG